MQLRNGILSSKTSLNCFFRLFYFSVYFLINFPVTFLSTLLILQNSHFCRKKLRIIDYYNPVNYKNALQNLINKKKYFSSTYIIILNVGFFTSHSQRP